MDNLTTDFICVAYELAILFDQKCLKNFCEQSMKRNPSTIFQSSNFLQCKRTTLRQILHLEFASKMDIFNAYTAWAKNACKRLGLNEHEPMNLRTQLQDLFYELPFGTLTKEEFFDVIPAHLELLSNEELKEIVALTALPDFEPTMFLKPSSKAEPIPIEMSSSIECNRIIPNSFQIKTIETTTFSSNKMLKLNGFSCANVYEYKKYTFYVTEFPLSKVTIIKRPTRADGQTKRILFNGEMKLVTHGENRFSLSPAIVITPGYKYDIRMMQNAMPNHFTFSTLKSCVNVSPDISIEFHANPSLDDNNTATGLVTSLSVEPLLTAVDDDFAE